MNNFNYETSEIDLRQRKRFEKKDLRKTVSRLSFIPILWIILSILFALPSIFFYSTTGKDGKNAIIAIASVLAYIVLFYIFSKLFNVGFSTMFPFNKIKSKSTMFGFIGLATSLMICCSRLFALIILFLQYLGINTQFITNTFDKLQDSDLFDITNPISIIIHILYAAIIPAVFEEFMYRGICLGLLRKYGDGFAIIISSLIFSFAHGNIIQSPFAFVVGLFLGYMAVKFNSLLPGIIVHFLNNSLNTIADILENIGIEKPQFIITAIAIAIGIISLIYLIKKKDSKLNSIKKSESLLTYAEKFRYSLFNAGMICLIIVTIILTNNLAH